VGDSHFLRDDRAVPVYDAGRLVALALGAAVAGAGGVDHRAGSSPISINLAWHENLSGLRQLHWPTWTDDPQGTCNFRAATNKMAQPQYGNDDTQERITCLQYQPPAAGRVAVRIPRGKKFSLRAVIAPTIAP